SQECDAQGAVSVIGIGRLQYTHIRLIAQRPSPRPK
ncbi:unnamed protein product, partial [marine sediment metagenome]